MIDVFQQIFTLMGIERVVNYGDIAGFLGVFFLLNVSILTFLNALKLKEPTQKPSLPEKKEEVKAEVKPEQQTQESSPTLETLSFQKRLFAGLSKSRGEVWGKLTDLFTSSKLSDDELDQLEELLYTSDLSPSLVSELIEVVKKSKDSEQSSKDIIFSFLKDKIAPVQEKLIELPNGLKVIMIVGVNGAGKTTTIGKLATRLKNEGNHVVVGACDTFRAAAIEQLEVWCQRAGVDLIKAKHGADPSGVAYDTLAQAIKLKADYCLLDTAGRLHTASNLMEELKKTKKVLSKLNSSAPHQTLLVIDAITGQNALRQAEEFNNALQLSGLIFTKCDGSAKAGSGVSLIHKLNVPIQYIGVGEGVEDLDVFNTDDYLNGLLGIES